MNVRAVAAAWIAAFSAVDLNKWNKVAVTLEDMEPLRHDW